MKSCKYISIIILLFFSFSKIYSQSPGSFIYILDGSGSMWGELSGSTKIGIAKDVMADLSSKHQTGDEVGLVVYGHRQKGDCNDVEFLIPLNTHDHQSIVAAVNGINPVGRTPLYNSAKMVIDQLKATGNASTVIMVTDGNETCEGDLCELVKQAKAEGIQFVMHIVGFGMGQEDRSALECAARATGGLYLDAEDAGQLSEALAQTGELTVDEIKPSLSVKSVIGQELIDALVEVYKSGTDDKVGGMRTYSSNETNPVLFSLPPGNYDVSISPVGRRGLTALWEYKLNLTGEEIVEKTFDFSSGKISVKVTDNDQLADATVNIYSKNDGKRVEGGRSYEAASSNPMIKELTPGLYDVVIKSVKINGLEAEKRFENVHIMGGEISEIHCEFASAILNVKVTYKGELCDATVNITSVSPKQPIDGGRTYTHASSNPKSFLLSPGTYEVQVRGVRVEGDPRESFTITLKKGDDVTREVVW